MTITKPRETVALVGRMKSPLGLCRGWGTFLYNTRDGTVLGRTGKSWMQILSFYILFYGVFAGVFAILLAIFLHTLNDDAPKCLDGIGESPGMGFRPMHPLPDMRAGAVIWVKNGSEANDQHISGLSDFLRDYEQDQTSENFMDCDNEHRPSNKQICRVHLTTLQPCTGKESFGYFRRQPCVLLKLNRIIGWQPVPYKKSEIPAEVHTSYAMLGNFGGTADFFSREEIYLTCDTDKPEDSHLKGQLSMYPLSIPTYYYPYMNQPGYLSPIVMVQFLNATPGITLDIRCKTWASNIHLRRHEGLGQVHFLLKIDEE